ncbi:MAG: peptide chain release factor 2 [Clostridiales bacterium]|jgi:peptide chain release factor 2|nr:peptide chain release factor 2 [Clostridiales bacterium]
MLEFDEFKLKVNSLKPKLEGLKDALGYDQVIAQIADLEAQASAEGFWGDLENSQKVLQKTKRLRSKASQYERLLAKWEDLYTLFELARDEEDLSILPELERGWSEIDDKIAEIKLQTQLSGEFDANNAILSFHAGAGGTEAQDWAQMLYRMYTRWAERKGFKYKVLDYLDGDEAGIKSAVILIEGENAFGFLQGESGVHRLVRISPFDASGRRHTSFAAVEVTPEITDDIQVDIRDEDLKVDTYRSSGAGGQHVNKTESAIRITHIPTGIVVACQNERSQHQNREVAMRMLKSKLVEIKEREHYDKIEDIKGVQMKIEWGSQIRSYVFMPYTLVKDHRTGFENGNINAVMDGDLNGFINAYLNAKTTGNL